MTVVLKGQEPEVLKMYADCVKFGTDEIGCLGDEYDKSLKPKLPNATQEEKQKTADAVFVKLIDLYLLARYLEDGETAHTVIDHIVHLSDDIHMIPSTSVDLAYSRTEKGDRLRQLMCDFWIYETAATGSKRLLDQVHDVEAKRDIGLGLLEFMAPVPGFQKSVAEDWFSDKCHYHDHSDGARCDWKGFN